jgi:hypothetical protein
MPQLIVKDANNANQTIGYYANTGQVVSSASIPVVLASDQPTIPVSMVSSQISSLANTALQSAQLNSINICSLELASIDSKMAPLGQAAMAASQPVVIASNQTPIDSDQILQKADGSFVQARATESNATSVGNFNRKFRDGFVTAQPDTSVWNELGTLFNSGGGTGFVNAGGNSSGSAYMRISLCPLTPLSAYQIWTKQPFEFPFRLGYGLSVSQRIVGQEIEVSACAVDSNGNIVVDAAPEKVLAISGTVTIASNVATVNFASAHTLNGGDRVVLSGNADPRLNVGPVAVIVVTPTQITVPCTLANGTYTANGFVKTVDPVLQASNAVGILYESSTTTTGSFIAKRNGAKFRSTASTVSTTTAVQSNTSPLTDAFNAAGDMEVISNMEECIYNARPNDALTASTGSGRYSQGVPDEELNYAVRIRVRNNENMTVPVARITGISKTGTTTAVVTTDVAHNLTTSDWVQIYGVRDQTNFPALTAQTQVASIVSPTQFTIVIGSAVTASSAGGVVWKVQGSVLAPGVASMAAQSISRTSNILTVVGSATWSGLLPGEYVHLYGCDATSMGLYDGAYKVLRLSTTTLELESIGADFVSINCGGAVIKRTDVRLHYTRMAAYTRHAVEVAGARGANDAARAVPVLTGSGSIITTVSAVTSVTSNNAGIPLTVADVTSAALTTTTTTSAITPASGMAYNVNVPVTAVSGTSPTLDFTIEESDDSGTNWYKVYDFPRITATGMYRSPLLKLRGNRVRYVQTVGGTSPSFTRSVNRLQSNAPHQQQVQLVDRAIVPNTGSSTSGALYVEGCVDFNLQVRVTAQTTAATIDLQVSDDSTNWVTVPSTSITTAVGTVRVVATNVLARFARAIVSAAGTGITLGELTLKGVGR